MLGLDSGISNISARRRSGPLAITYDFTSGSLPPGVALSRASVAKRVNAAGLLESVLADMPRFDHDADSLLPRGLLVEPAATNLVLQSSDIGQAPWIRSNCIATGNSIAGPDGVTRGGWALGNGYVYQDFAVTSGAIYTTSIWIRANFTATIGLRNLNNPDTVSRTIGPQWQRISVSGVAAGTSCRFLLDNRTVSGFGTFGLEVFLWGAQVESGAMATSPISTAAARADRSADVVGLLPISGSRDVQVTYDDGSMDRIVAQTITSGWWPMLSRPRVRKMTLRATI